MSEMTARLIVIFGLLGVPGLFLAGCGGNKMLSEPHALELAEPIAVTSDTKMSVELDWVIVRDGPGTWSKNADWDEYLLRVRNNSSGDITVDRISLVDSLGASVDSSTNRKELIKGSKATAKRYKNEGLQVKAGLGGVGLAAVGGATFLGGGAVLSATGLYATGATGALSGIAATSAVLVAPALIVGGIIRGANNTRVSIEINDRHSVMPLTLRTKEDAALNIFFPITPSPTGIEIRYSSEGGVHVLSIDLSEFLDGLHLRDPAEEENLGVAARSQAN